MFTKQIPKIVNYIAILLFFSTSCLLGQSLIFNPEDEGERSLGGFALADMGAIRAIDIASIPGSIGVSYMDKEGKKVYIVGAVTCFKPNSAIPKAEVKPFIYKNKNITKEMTVDVNFMIFFTKKVKIADITKFHLSRTTYTGINKKEIDWDEFRKQKNMMLKGTTEKRLLDAKFFVIEAATVLEINYLEFKEQAFEASGDGYGIKIGGKYFHQNSDEVNDQFVAILPAWENPLDTDYVRVEYQNTKMPSYKGKTFSLTNLENTGELMDATNWAEEINRKGIFEDFTEQRLKGQENILNELGIPAKYIFVGDKK